VIALATGSNLLHVAHYFNRGMMYSPRCEPTKSPKGLSAKPLSSSQVVITLIISYQQDYFDEAKAAEIAELSVLAYNQGRIVVWTVLVRAGNCSEVVRGQLERIPSWRPNLSTEVAGQLNWRPSCNAQFLTCRTSVGPGLGDDVIGFQREP
jgi:hypothetical protein